jgi:phosphoribosylformimino-5-aminoimidazole carboxamide ribotide isomerase
MNTFTIYPAIDVRGGAVVRLRQGDYARQTRYVDDPFVLAQAYANAGAQWLHLVDLDAARSGGYALAPLLRRIKSETALRVQTGGGVRNAEDVAALFDAGADRVVIGSLAVRSPEIVREWIARFGSERIVVALDTRAGADDRWRLPVHGWTELASDNAGDLETLLDSYARAGLRHLLCTDISRDGMLAGPNLHLYRRLHAIAPGVAVQASGGVRDIGDALAAREIGCAGVVLGRALLEGRIGIEEALAC